MQEKFWTPERTELLKKLYPTCTADELVVFFKTTKTNIRNKANRMKLHKNVDVKTYILTKNGMKNLHHAKTKEAQKKRCNSIKEMIKKERLRIAYGLPQKTKRVFSSLTPRDALRHAKIRYYLRKYGYILTKNDSKIAYYINDAKRKKITEEHYKKLGYQFKPIEYLNEKENIRAYDPEPLPFNILI